MQHRIELELCKNSRSVHAWSHHNHGAVRSSMVLLCIITMKKDHRGQRVLFSYLCYRGWSRAARLKHNESRLETDTPRVCDPLDPGPCCTIRAPRQRPAKRHGSTTSRTTADFGQKVRVSACGFALVLPLLLFSTPTIVCCSSRPALLPIASPGPDRLPLGEGKPSCSLPPSCPLSFVLCSCD